jgi:hypothetical protein
MEKYLFNSELLLSFLTNKTLFGLKKLLIKLIPLIKELSAVSETIIISDDA